MIETPSVTSLPADLRDDEGDLRQDVVALVEQVVASGNAEALKALLADMHEADLGDLLELLDTDARLALIRLMGDDFDFTALTELDEGMRAEILDELPVEAVAEGVRDLDSDDAVAILEDLEDDERDQVLDRLSAVERIALKRALDYPEDSAGRLMKSDFIAVPPFWTVARVIDHLRASDDLPDDFTEIFVVDPGYRLQGVLRLDTLLRSAPDVAAADLAEEANHTIEATDDQHDAALVFQRYNLLAAPVVDDSNRLVGVLTVDDMVDVIEEEADAEIKALGGVKADEELSDRVWSIARSRFGWLFVNLVTAFLASTVLKGFAHQMEAMVALAVLAPIVASQGGNAGTQTMTVIVRALATHDLGSHNMMRVLMREAMVGLLNGFAFAVITGIIASLWFGIAELGYVIGLAMICNLLAAALGGVLIPLIIDRYNFDPAVASGAFVTTITDVVGFFAFLGIASWWFRL